MVKEILGERKKIRPHLLLKVIGFQLMAFFILSQVVAGEVFYLTASWYAIKDLKSSGQWKLTKGVMANGEKFKDEAFTCATRDYPLGIYVKVINLETSKSVIVKVTDRINKRFKGKRIDLSKGAFQQIANPRIGIVKVRVEEVIR